MYCATGVDGLKGSHTTAFVTEVDVPTSESELENPTPNLHSAQNTAVAGPNKRVGKGN